MSERQKRKQKKAKKLQQKLEEQKEAYEPKVPKCVVFRRGSVGTSVKELERDIRAVLYPNTLVKLKEKNKNTLKDFVSVASTLLLSHLWIITQTAMGTYFRIGKLPRGPTLKFKVKQFCLISDLRKQFKNPVKGFGAHYLNPPILVLNNFRSTEKHMEMMKIIFQSIFPGINIKEVEISRLQRVVLFNYNSDTETIEFRHYLVRINQIGLSKSIKRIIQNKATTIAKHEDIADYVLSNSAATESDREDAPESRFDMFKEQNSKTGRKNVKLSKSSVRLQEIGPRIDFELVKIEAELCDGAVLYHKYFNKTANEIKQQEVMKQRKKQEKERRKHLQQQNVERKQLIKKIQQDQNDRDDEQNDNAEDDLQTYKEEVGDEPDKDTIATLKGQDVNALKTPKYNPLYKKRKRPEGESKQNNGPPKKKPKYIPKNEKKKHK
eukprot:TRINITY_DN477_c0_g1_i1.p1 TRINITY_DN477_c0_g1~~TRINITY_DN477_c0_g1_i1.p1  ORF type:complete len:436 (+),score=111.73 TRINITY_DN477_c0_g1_i1:81-1388(+)